LKLDKNSFDKFMSERQKQSREGAKFDSHEDVIVINVRKNNITLPASKFIYNTFKIETEVIELLKTQEILEDKTYPNFHIVLKETPFYVEAGGQISDDGFIYSNNSCAVVKYLYKIDNSIIHECELRKGSEKDFHKGSKVTAEVDSDRRWSIMRNHTVTHLTHAALRKVLGNHIKQSGSYVGPDRMRFDFSHHQPMTDNEIKQVEKIVNSEILKNNPVLTEEMSISEAKRTGAMALFGEKYEDTVRVVSVNEFSKELCGGTHVDNVSQIGPFFITLETGIASGIRRIEAITGEEAIKYMLEAKSYRKKVADIIGRPESDSLAGVEQLKDQYSSLQKELKKVKANMFSNKGNSVGEEFEINGLTVVTHDFGETDRDIMASWLDSNKEQNRAIVAFAYGIVGTKPTFMGSASSSGIKEFKIHIGNIIKEVLKQFNGSGGGKPNFAQGSVGDNINYKQLIEKSIDVISNMMK